MERLIDRARGDLERAKLKGDKFTMVQHAKGILQGQRMLEKYLINRAKVESLKSTVDLHFGNFKRLQLNPLAFISWNEDGELTW
jgi:hypothetical protein